MSTIETNNWIRKRILEELYKMSIERPEEFGFSRENLLKTLGVAPNLLDSNIIYLKEKTLITTYEVIGSLFAFAKITAFGVDVVEQKEQFSAQFPFIVNINSQVIEGNAGGPVVQAVNSTNVNTTQTISDSFLKARENIIHNSSLSEEVKQEAFKNLDAIEGESKKSPPDAGTIQKAWKWIKENIPTVAILLAETVKTIISGSINP